MRKIKKVKKKKNHKQKKKSKNRKVAKGYINKLISLLIKSNYLKNNFLFDLKLILNKFFV